MYNIKSKKYGIYPINFIHLIIVNIIIFKMARASPTESATKYKVGTKNGIKKMEKIIT